MEEMLFNNLPFILTFLITVPVVWKYGRRILKLLKEVEDVLKVLRLALVDEKLTKDELDKILKELKDIPQAVKDLVKKNGDSDDN